jgi:hypothetical protein
MLFVRAGRLPVTIAGLLPARAKYFWADKSDNVSGFLYTTLQSKRSQDAQERQAENRFSYLRKWLIAASRAGRGNFSPSAAKCRSGRFQAFPPRSIASKLCPHSGPATASHRPGNKIVHGTAALLQTNSTALFSPAGLYPIPPTHARDPARPVSLFQTTQPDTPCAKAPVCLRVLRPALPRPRLRHCAAGPGAVEGAGVTTLKYTPWDLK